MDNKDNIFWLVERFSTFCVAGGWAGRPSTPRLGPIQPACRAEAAEREQLAGRQSKPYDACATGSSATAGGTPLPARRA